MLVVLFILLPMSGFNFYGMFLDNSMSLHHLICPILSIITFVLYDDLGKFEKKDILLSLLFTIIYSVVAIVLNITGNLVGPYPFLMVKKQSIIVSVIWIIVIYSLVFLIAYVLRILRNKKSW
jgi:hypothetical protein